MLSVIVPTFNRASSLKLAIKSFCSQNFLPKQFEIIVVDNGSTDNTKQVTEAAVTTYPSHQIRYILEPEPGLLSGRHRGALQANGNILIFVDDDIEADVNWLQAIEESFADPSVKLVGGRNLPNYEVEPPEWLEFFWDNHSHGRVCGYLSLLDFGDQSCEIDANYVWGLNFSIRRKALFELGGFHPDCVTKHLQHFQGDGETGLTQKAAELGYKAIYQPKALVLHQVTKERMTYEYFDKRCFYQGVCNSYTEIRQMKGNLKPKTLKEKVKAYLKQLKQELLTPNKNVLEKSLRRRFNKALLEGYQFHQNTVCRNPELINWILKEDYWDYKLPNLNLS